MKRDPRHARPGTALPAFWWTLAAVHMLPAARVVATLGDDPLRAAATLAMLLGVIAYCVLAARVTGRHLREARWSGTVAFVLAAVVAHHDAVGGLPPAELTAPAVPVLLIAAGSRRTRRIAAAAGGSLRDDLAAQAAGLIDLPRAVVTAALGQERVVARVALAAPSARGPPA